jgi:hypothetical protein
LLGADDTFAHGLNFEELDIEEFSWDGLVIKDEDEEDMYWHCSQSE